MKKFIFEFIRRGMVASGFGPIALAVVYMALKHFGKIETLNVEEVSVGILSLTALAFIAGAMNVLYHIDRLPLMLAILIHGVVLYFGYLGTYLINGWLNMSRVSFLMFTVIFVVGYFAIWAVIYSVTKKDTSRLNEKLMKNRQRVENE
ncbi:MAG: DUF3021 domain-containing protein [Ruminococcaceae bacterium]|nr:DUF3021 domain-containing protein [Oscillospiraceae bacterium]